MGNFRTRNRTSFANIVEYDLTVDVPNRVRAGNICTPQIYSSHWVISPLEKVLRRGSSYKREISTGTRIK